MMKNKINYETPQIISQKIFDASTGGLSIFAQCADHGYSWTGIVNNNQGVCKNKANV